MRKKLVLLTGIAFACLASMAKADNIKIGVVVSTTGSLASLGIPMKNALALMPPKIAGNDISYIILDDESDTTTARKHAEKLVSEDKVDAIIGPSSTPNTLAIIEVAARARTPLISLGAGTVIVQPMDPTKRWIFKTPYNDSTLAEATVRHMSKAGAETAAIIGFNDAYGESWINEFNKVAKATGISVKAVERYDRNDTSVTAQVLKVMAMKPDVVLVVAGGTPGVLPQATLRERGYKGAIYQTTGIVSNEFIRVGGKSVEGTLVASGPFVVATDIPANHPAKLPAEKFKARYEQAYGAGTATAFSGIAWNAGLILEAAIPKALAKAQPGTPEFRSSLRDAIENTKNLPTTDGVNTMSTADHNGFSAETSVIIRVKDGAWRLAN